LLLVAFGGRSMQASLPFGTFIAVAAFVASLVGERLFALYVATLQ
jgi:prepilin signal peptidase PulO-like enzyme (type II secretory pathway)